MYVPLSAEVSERPRYSAAASHSEDEVIGSHVISGSSTRTTSETIYSAVCGIYDANHAKFNLNFTDEAGMEMIFNNLVRNINTVNACLSIFKWG